MVSPTRMARRRQDCCHSAGRGIALSVPFPPSSPLAGGNCRILRCFGFQQREAFQKSLKTELLLCTVKNSAILVSLRRYLLRCGHYLRKHPRVEGSLRAGDDVVLKPNKVAWASCPQASFIRGADGCSLPC